VHPGQIHAHVAAVANGFARDANHRRETKHGLEAVGVGGRAETAHQQPLHLHAQGAAGLSVPNFALFERTLQVSDCGIALLSQKTAGDEIAHVLVLNHTHAVGKHRTAIFRIGAGAAVTCARQTSRKWAVERGRYRNFAAEARSQCTSLMRSRGSGNKLSQ
jgi:hypothetical protein